MTNKIIIAVDAMGGDNSPKKIIEGIEISLKKDKGNFFHLYGDEDILKKKFLVTISLVNIVKLLTLKTSYLIMKVLLRQQKKEKNQACGKL